MLSTDKQTDKLTNATKNITSFDKEVIKTFSLINKVWSKYYIELTLHKNHKGSGSLPVPRSGHARAIMFLLIFSSYPTQIKI